MPLYDYRCSSCEHEEEVSQKISDAPLTVCPSCGKGSFERLVSRSSFALRGSGWYADGYAAKADKADKADKPAAKASKADKPEKAPDTKAEPAKASEKAESKTEAKSGLQDD